jgi:hypothetical protein
MPELRLAVDAGSSLLSKRYAIEDVLPRRQAVEQHLCGEIAGLQGVGGRPSQGWS